MIRYFLTILVILIVSYGCKKSSLSGTHSTLIGEWVWYSGYDDDGSTSIKLKFKEEGKYKLYKGNKLLDRGRLILENGYMTFHSDVIIKDKYYEKKNIVLFKQDTIIITRVALYDQPVSYFKKN